MSNKDTYRELCAAESTIPLFSQDWWLDCVCGEDKWDVLLVEKNGVIEACFSFYMPVSKVISMPPLTKTMGIWFNPAFILPNYSKELLRKQRLCKELIQQLPKFSNFSQNFHHSFTDWLPFYWAGFKQTTRYTYILPDISNLDTVWNNISPGMRKTNIQWAERYGLQVKPGISIDAFLAIHEQSYRRQGLKSKHDIFLRKAIETTRLRNQGEIFGAYDNEGRLHSAAFVVWQSSCVYGIAAGNDLTLRGHGGMALVQWEIIKCLSPFIKSFDFTGSMLMGVENFNKNFGAIQTPYFAISKGKMGLWQRGVLFLKR